MLSNVRLRIIAEGLVQGVGFRPFVFKLAKRYLLNGFVMNTSDGVYIEIEGSEKVCLEFLATLQNEIPLPARVDHLTHIKLDLFGYDEFVILESSMNGSFNLNISPDLAICPECTEEILSPNERRYLYPFTNCMRCGPRYSILEQLPYDRKNTTMEEFKMCPKCTMEYRDPKNRRFHAQPIACHDCGPEVFLTKNSHQIIARHSEAISIAASYLKEGKILALKGIGGFHLIADARNSDSIKELRTRKHRLTKPFAIMFKNTEQIRDYCEMSVREEEALSSQEAPIVLLKKKNSLLPHEIAPNNHEWGCLLPYSGLHLLLLKEFGHPLIITSANEDSEPLVYENDSAVQRLSQMADFFLMHNRKILNPVDDSIVRVIHNAPMILRKARGYAPSSMKIKNISESPLPETLALGSYLKNTFAVNNATTLIQSPHNGDMKSSLSRIEVVKSIEKTINLLKITPKSILLDSNREDSMELMGSNFYHRLDSDNPVMQVNHHEAHIFSVVAEHDLKPPILGFAWDGLGIGPHGELRGGETYLINSSDIHHVASLIPIPVLGGDKSTKEPRLVALGLLWTLYGDTVWTMNHFLKEKNFSEKELSIFRSLLDSGNFKMTSSLGRLCDGVSSILNFCHINTYEGEAAQILESSMKASDTHFTHQILIEGFKLIKRKDLLELDWRDLIRSLFEWSQKGRDPQILAYLFHKNLVEMLTQCAQHFDIPTIALSGGCFQNRFLIEKGVKLLKDNKFEVYWNQTTPTNDGGISLGQWAQNVFSHTR